MNPIDVSVITVTYNSAGCVSDFLGSVRAQKGVAAEIIVVDNASKDETAQIVRAGNPGVHFIENRENLGFGRACNQGFKASRGRFIYLLNPDAQLIGNDALANLCRALEAHPRWGMAGTAFLTPDGQPKGTLNKDYPGESSTRTNFSHLPGSIAWVIGASMFVRREAYEAVGGFDPNFFLYAEDTDLCLRLRQQGYEIGVVETVKVQHVGAASEKGMDPYEASVLRTKGIHLFWKKYFVPEDVAKLVRRDQRRARYRMVLNGLLAAAQPPHSMAWRKARRYRATYETSARFLAEQQAKT